ncbi:undecaprenyldiphospho-muramoylpentapeptide beta-N-acetylglucosaminyltransferase [Alishewanella jeotgali]|uniref:UDP-N-acetylglucosamine--N-acetylmuramyl-(pentapeptide) pyrophosphoryl-undecaprenol N-acetylglucosamine transferase n=1 Tax=Alishewanella jeotgali KCTC 22429 TaxID=1129374 RepID=H3ZDH5_9ALTE|nr:undecaprenyldiphospho-muramoylpentapeptide beta-N-acetylglucosaminyltransferase [Alishewanella jeotgali]EHR41349.1 undecaprenyldiphospho-muramoylpentapeptide beta-N- acetylglucosaminyltransferase [Alishewanella jeotgali KCTC 22429]
MTKPLALIMAGGTGGHIFPAQAVANALQQAGWDIAWLGTADRMEAQLVPEFGYPFYSIKVAGLRGKGLGAKLAAPFMLLRSVWQARQIIKQIKPQLVIGFGGYASGPGGFAAWLGGIPLLIHEQNAVPGSTNKLLARFAEKIMVAFPEAFASSVKQQLVGNPVRKEVIGCREQRPVNAELRILIVGGSLGAKALNEQLPPQLIALAHQGVLAVKHQTGDAMYQQVYNAYQPLREQGLQIEVCAFIKNMAEAYRWADLVICRAGALTVSEVAAAGIAAIFVPLPTAIDDHQTANAKTLTSHDAGWLLPQHQLMAPGIVPILAEFMHNKAGLAERANKARALALDNATAQVVTLCQQVTGQVV